MQSAEFFQMCSDPVYKTGIFELYYGATPLS